MYGFRRHFRSQKRLGPRVTPKPTWAKRKILAKSRSLKRSENSPRDHTREEDHMTRFNGGTCTPENPIVGPHVTLRGEAASIPFVVSRSDSKSRKLLLVFQNFFLICFVVAQSTHLYSESAKPVGCNSQDYVRSGVIRIAIRNSKARWIEP